MNWEMITALGEIAGAAAVVASLVYLARQLAVGNRLARAEAWRLPNSGLANLNATFATDLAFRRAFQKVLVEGKPRSALDEDERVILGLYLVSATNLYAQLCREVREGVLDDSALAEFPALSVFSTPYYKSSWPAYRVGFDERFVAFMEEAHGLAAGDRQTSLDSRAGKVG